jgi:fatty-acyl-CoA synthase
LHIFIITRAGAVIEPGDIITRCSACLARFKVLVFVVDTDNIPRTASGKVQKHMLKKIGE